MKEKVYLCSRIKTITNGKKTFEPPKGGIGRKEHDEQASGRVGGQRPSNGVQMGYQCGPAKCRNAHSHLETFGGERGRFIMDRIKCHKNEYKIILGSILKRF